MESNARFNLASYCNHSTRHGYLEAFPERILERSWLAFSGFLEQGRPSASGIQERPYCGIGPKAEEIKLIERLSPMEDEALAALKAGVESGDIRWIKLYLEYYVGKPKETKDITINEDLPLFIEDLD